jgi:hypothetical protein
MVFDQIDKLKREYTDKYVVVDAGRPDLARFRGITGRIRTVNMSGRALVEFDAYNNIGWYDIALDFLKVVDQPPPKPAESHEKPAKKEAPAPADGAKVAAAKAEPKTAAPAGEKKLSPIEMARAQGAAKKPGEAPKKSTADILAAARGKAAAAAPVAKAAPPAVKDAPAEAKKPSAPASKPAAPAPKPAAPAPKPAASTGKLSTADILAAARANKAAAAAPKAAAPAPAAPTVVEEPAATVVEEAPEATAEPEAAPEPVAAVEKPAALSKSSGGKPSGTAEILAWCREHDAK